MWLSTDRHRLLCPDLVYLDTDSGPSLISSFHTTFAPTQSAVSRTPFRIIDATSVRLAESNPSRVAQVIESQKCGDRLTAMDNSLGMRKSMSLQGLSGDLLGDRHRSSSYLSTLIGLLYTGPPSLEDGAFKWSRICATCLRLTWPDLCLVRMMDNGFSGAEIIGLRLTFLQVCLKAA